jgi:hypothetical protein
MFRRRRRDEDAQPADAEASPVAVEEVEEPAGPPTPTRPQGPYDVDDAPEDPEGFQRLDLGGMRVAMTPGLEVRVDMDASQKVVAATLVDGASALQVNVFAAPRTEGIWDEVRAEILTSVEASGGGGTEIEGSFGTEVQARVPAGQPAPGKTAPLVDARFVGIDGPRWFVRGLFSGPAATDPSQAERLSEALRAVVVVRGSDAMAPREPLPLVLPANVAEAAAAAHAQATASEDGSGQAGDGAPGQAPAAAPSAAPSAAPPAAPPGQAAGVPSRPQRASLQGHLAQAAQAARARAAAAQAQAEAQGQSSGQPAQAGPSTAPSGGAAQPPGATPPAAAPSSPEAAPSPQAAPSPRAGASSPGASSPPAGQPSPSEPAPTQRAVAPEESPHVELHPEGASGDEGEDVGLEVLDSGPEERR